LLTTAVNPVNGGTASPVSGTYYPSGTVVNLSAAPVDGYLFGVWSGSVDSAGNASTTVTMSAPQSVTANFYPVSTPISEWTWEGGNSTGNNKGVYGTLKSPSLNNIPGGRSAGNSWTDGSGNLWIFGGKGYDSTGALGLLNDLWEFNPASGWAWMGGSSTVGSKGGQPGVYGALGTPDVNNIPGGRQYAVSWTDSSGNFWLFGGYGYDSAGTGGALHDLWKFDPSTKAWTWMSGYSAIGNSTGAGGQLGIYGTPGSFDALNLPGSRQYAVGWADSSGNLWLFGGEGSDSKGTLGYLNDLWEFSPSQGVAGQWAWMGGSSTASKYSASYGPKGSAQGTNIPGGRLSALSWTDKNGNFWLFGGEGYDANGVFGELNDLWEFNPASLSTGWMWVSGSNTTIAYGGQPGIYGTLGVPAAGNLPGSRQDATGWADSSGNLWLLGGLGIDLNGTLSSYPTPLNDLWEFNPSTSLWTWMGDANTNGSKGIYGALGTFAAGDAPGARYFAASWIDGNGNPWIFGGYGKDGNGSYGYLNDSWTLAVAAVNPPPAPTIDTEPTNPTTATTAAFTFSDTQAGVTYQCSLDSAAYATCASGVSYSSLSVGSHTFAVEALAGAGNSSTATTYSWTVNVAPPPAPTIDTEPANPTTATTAAFTFSDTQSGVTYQCILDSAAYATCASGVSYSSLSVGSHTFAVEALAGAGNNSTATTYSWTINAPPPPAPTIDTDPTNPTTATTAAFTFSDTQSGVTYQCSLDSAAYATCASGVSYSTLAVGSHTFAVEALAGAGNNSTATSYNWTINAPPTVATPQILPATGIYNTNQNVTIKDATDGALVCYTIDNSAPTASNGACTHGTTYGGAISVVQTGTTVKAIGALSGDTNSAIAAATYTLQAVAPTLNPPGGTYIGVQSVSLSTTTAGSEIYYTTDGSAPTDAPGSTSTHYTTGTPISVTASGTVIKAITIDDGYENSTVSTGTYTLQFPAVTLTPSLTFTANTGTTSAPQSATLQNTGNAALTGIAISIAGTNPSDFAQSATTCGTSLAAGASCTISITFTPASEASESAAISVSDNASGSPQTTMLNGTGTAPPVPSYSVASPTPAQTVQPGGAASYTINVNPVNGAFSSVVTLSASGLPSGAAAVFSPATVTPGAAGASSQLTIQTATTTISNAGGSGLPLAAPALALIALFLLPGKRRRRWIILGVLLIASMGALTALTACGGGFAGHGSASQSYTITVTGSSGAIQQTTTVQLTVQ
jgi:hypothetical protein